MKTILLTLLTASQAPVAALAEGHVWGEIKGELKTALETKGDPVRGEALFEPCTGCHRVDGSGRTSGAYPRLAGQHATVIIKQVIDIRSGLRSNPKMELFADDHVINAYEIADIAAFLTQLPIGTGNGKGPGRDLAKGQSIYEDQCVQCHGEKGEGRADRFYPEVAAQHYKYLLRELKLIRDGDRKNANPDMVKVVKPMDNRTLEALADYLASLPPPPKKAPPATGEEAAPAPAPTPAPGE